MNVGEIIPLELARGKSSFINTTHKNHLKSTLSFEKTQKKKPVGGIALYNCIQLTFLKVNCFLSSKKNAAWFDMYLCLHFDIS